MTRKRVNPEEFGMKTMGDILARIAHELGCQADSDEIFLAIDRLTRELTQARAERDAAVIESRRQMREEAAAIFDAMAEELRPRIERRFCLEDDFEAFELAKFNAQRIRALPDRAPNRDGVRL